MHGKVETKTELQHLTHDPGFVWLRSLQRHWHNHGISESLEEQDSLGCLPGWRQKCPAHLLHPVATRLWQSPGLKLYSEYQQGVVFLIQTPTSPKEACLSTFQVTVWYVVLLGLNSCLRCCTTLCVTQVWAYVAHLLSLMQSGELV